MLYRVGPWCLSILYIIAYICRSKLPGLPAPTSWQPQVCSLCLGVYFCFAGISSFVPYFRFHILWIICLSLSDWLHFVWSSLGVSVMPHMALFHSFLWLNSIPLCICATSSLSIHLSVGISVVSVFWLLWRVLYEYRGAGIFLNYSLVWIYA